MSTLIHALTRALSGYEDGRQNVNASQAAAERQRKAEERQARLDQIDADYKGAQTSKLNAEAQAPQKPEPFNAVKARVDRIKELQGQGMKLEDAVKQARAEQGEVDAPRTDPVAVHAAQRDYDITHPLPHSEGGGSEVLVKVQGEDGSTILVPRSQAAGMKAGQSSSGGPTRQQRIQAVANVNDALNSFETTLSKTGAVIMPGVAKSGLQTDYENLQLQMKELYNLGVLNGPDLALMRRVLNDPTDVKGFALAGGNLKEQTKRTQAQIGKVREKIEGIRANLEKGNEAVRAPGSAPSNAAPHGGQMSYEEWKASKGKK
jgi:hypothetical protein